MKKKLFYVFVCTIILAIAGIAGSCGDDGPKSYCHHWTLTVIYPDGSKELYTEGWAYGLEEEVYKRVEQTEKAALDNILEGTGCTSELSVFTDGGTSMKMYANAEKCAEIDRNKEDYKEHCWHYTAVMEYYKDGYHKESFEGYIWGTRDKLFAALDELEMIAKYSSQDPNMSFRSYFSKYDDSNDEESCLEKNKTVKH